MYKLNEKIASVLGFGFDSKGHCLYNERRKIINLKTKQIIYEHNQDFQELFFHEMFIVNDLYGKGIYIDSTQNIVQTDFFIRYIQRNHLIYTKRINEERYTFFKNLSNDNYTLIKFSSLIDLISNDFYIFFDSLSLNISLFSFPNAINIWNFNLSSLGTYQNDINESHPFTVNKFVGIWNNLLLVQLNGYSLLALDVNTGELVKHIPLKTTLDLPQGQYLIDEPNMHLVNDSIIWLSNQHLIHIELNNWDIQTKAINHNLPREQEWRCFKNTYFDGLLYFVADYGWQYVTPSWIGVMNAQTGEVLWKQQLEKTGGLPEAPQVNEKNLYIRTAKGDLHIFERE